MGTFDNKRSESAHRLRRSDFRTGRSDDHRVLRLRHDSALHIEESRIRHHGPGSYETVQENRGTRLKPMGPPLRKRQRLEFVRNEPDEANGSMATTSPASRKSWPWAMLGTLLPAWSRYRSIVWPVRFRTGRYPCASIARWIPSPIARVGTPACTASIAVWSASSEARTSSVQFRVPTSTVSAVSAIQPSSWAPRSSFTTFPWRNLSASSWVGE